MKKHLFPYSSWPSISVPSTPPDYGTFLRDTLLLALTSFGGPSIHLTLYIKHLVYKRNYLSEAELMELNALCQLLPGPTSTQTLLAVAYKTGGWRLAMLSLLVWILPASMLMGALAMLINYLNANNYSLDFLRFVQPVAVGFLFYAAYRISTKVLQSRLSIVLMVLAGFASFLITVPWLLPLVIIAAGVVTGWRYKELDWEPKEKMRPHWQPLLLMLALMLVSILAAEWTGLRVLRITESFLRNGAVIFGGGQVLFPLLLKEFVEFKGYLSSEAFLSGLGLAQAMPGPVFAFSTYIGTLSMKDYGSVSAFFSGLLASFAVFLPGTLLIFFLSSFWDTLKKYRGIRASMEGILAASCGLVAAAAIIMLLPMQQRPFDLLLIAATFSLLQFTRVFPPVIVLGSLLLGIVLS